MQLTHEGWSQDRGWFCDKYNIDTTRTDHEIHWKNGKVCRQLSPFEIVTTDWNNDSEIYSEFGANFESQWGVGRDWYTPQNLLGLVLDGEATVQGIVKVK